MRISLLLLALAPALVFADDWKTEEEAQKIAEQVVHAPVNNDKRREIRSPKTVTLQAKMLGIIRTVTDLQGSDASIDASDAKIADADAKLQESLARLNAEISADEVRIRLETAVLFAFDSSKLRPDALQQLSDVLTVLGGYPTFPITVEGHTCSMGTEEYNQKLSTQRANSVKEWLITQKILRSRLSVQGYGESRPIADNSEEEGRMKNRRVELVMQKR